MFISTTTRSSTSVRSDKPSLKPKAASTEITSPERLRAPVSASVQSGARARHAALGQQVRPTVTAGADITRLADAITRAPNDETRREAVLAATQELRVVLATKSPAERTLALNSSSQALTTIAQGLSVLNTDERKEALAALARAAEVAGPEGAALIAKPIALALPSLVRPNSNDLNELSGALFENVKAGHGSLLGAALVQQVSQTGNVAQANALARGHATGLQAVREEFEEANANANQLDAVLANQVQAWQGTLTPEQIQAGVDRFRAENADAYAAREQAALRLAQSLPGAAYTADHPVSRDGLDHTDLLAQQSSAALRAVPQLVVTDNGARLVGEALQQRGNGAPTFLDAAQRAATTPEARDSFENAVLLAASSRGDGLARGGRLADVPAVIRGAAGLVNDPGLKATLEVFGQEVDRIARQGLPPDRAARALLQASTAALNQAPRLGATGASAAKFAAFARGLGIGAVALAGARFLDDPSVRSGLETLGAALPAGVAFTTGATRALLSKAGLAATLAFSAFDTVAALRRGDRTGAALAAAPAAGAAIGAGIGVWAFGVGAIPGAIIGGAIGTVLSVGAKLFGVGQDDPVVAYEEQSESFLRGALSHAGLPEDAAHRLRDVDGDLLHVGHLFPNVAQRLGITPQELFERVALLDDESRKAFVKEALRVGHNAEAIQEASAAGTEPPALAFNTAQLDALAERAREEWPDLA